jgi:DNA (cytosine-5)-methyltransferase 1
MLSLCSGIGGADLAAEWTGEIEIVGQVEINPFCQRILAAHWPDVERASDIREVQGDEFGPIDIVAGGIPCQPFSSAGKRRGVEDDRHLWPYAFAIIQKARPRWVLIENVRHFVHLALDLLLSDLAGAGYEAGAVVLPACAVGAPHIRERCFVLAYHSGLGERSRRTQPAGQFRTPNLDRSGSPHVAHAQHRGRERRVLDAYQSGATVLSGSTVAGREPQPGMDRMFHGISARLDSALWPAPPGPQFTWEPRRVVGRVSERRERIEALGNAIVPYQIYPLFAGIVEWEMGMEAAS